jgi:hypothetical protein
MKFTKLQMVLLLMAGISFGLLSCDDLEKYQKPAEISQPQPQTKTVDLKGTAEEREQGRQFAARLETVRATFAASNDTAGVLNALDTLLAQADTQLNSMPEQSEFRAFYLLMMADILNQVSYIKQSNGDDEGAREAQRKLFEIERQLPK